MRLHVRFYRALVAAVSAGAAIGGCGGASPPRLDGTWIAHADIVSSQGGGQLQTGGQIDRVWVFRHQCLSGQCGLYWTREIDLGTFTARVHIDRGMFTATFSNEPVPCVNPANPYVTTAMGYLTSTFALRYDADRRRLYGFEHTHATTMACDAVDHQLSWSATPSAAPIPVPGTSEAGG